MKIEKSNSFQLLGMSVPAAQLPAGLYVVATPIGNLGDITLRALETLAGCTIIACEDTRKSGILLKRFGIDRPKVSYTEHNANVRGPDLLRQISEGAAVALISDAGTPLVSDPGFRLVQQAAALKLPVIPLPGASAPLAALVGSGLASDDFRFCGFLPSKSQARIQRLSQLARDPYTLIFFDSPNRLKATLSAMVGEFGADRRAVVARELTKMHESFYRGSLEELNQEFEAMGKVRGEIVIVVAGASPSPVSEENVENQLREALQMMKTKQAAAFVAKSSGLSKQELYKQALTLKDDL
ncbi:MAG: 16S rRNA (cytidine(1402)-2'-O)-methyltransferase [Rhizobiaceae bacterium]|nr:16S rRNA (cytidine(1402)-2'-O)-methyltransferase [Rhizobiaceae bacterium]